MTNIKDLEKAAREGKLDRREFMRRAGALGLAAPFAASLLSQSVHAAMPKRGGKFSQGTGHGQTTDSLDPGTHENGFMQNMIYTYANHLFEVDNNGAIQPELAESYEASDGANRPVVVAAAHRTPERHSGEERHRGTDRRSDGSDENVPVLHVREFVGKNRLEFLISELEIGLDKIDFSADEFIEIERENVPWPADEAALDNLWRKRLKAAVLSMKLNGKELEEVQELLTKRYTNRLKQAKQTNYQGGKENQL